MKKLIFTLLLFGTSFFLKAQNLSPNYFPKTGNVGIGTTTPNSKLDFGSNYSSPSTYPNKITLWSGGENNYFGFGISGGSLDYFSQSKHSFYTEYAGKTGSEKMVLLGNGNLGIGVSMPRFKLDVVGAINATEYLLNGRPLSTSSSPWTINAADISFSTGNVGIGTTTPKEKLDVRGVINISRGSKNSFIMSDHDPKIWSTGTGETLPYPFSDYDLGHLVLQSRGSELRDILFITGNGDDIRMAVKGNGNVGIGTTTPSAKLEVNGNMSITGDLKMSGSDSYIWTNGTGTGYTGIWDAKNNRTLLFASETTGYVGIGTTTPSATFDVAGTINATEYLLNGRPLSASTSSSPWVANAADISFSTGNVGIGTTTPTSKLHVNGGNALIQNYSPILTLKRDGNSGGYIQGIQTEQFDGSPNFWFGNHDEDEWLISKGEYNGTRLFTVKTSGNVGIGTTTPKSKLAVNGEIRATEIKVLADVNVPDYVFASDYKLPTLQETAAYIKKNHHLSEIPSAKEIGENGFALGKMNMSLLKKIEELTLYAIAQENRLKSQSKELKSKDAVIQSILKRLEALEKK